MYRTILEAAILKFRPVIFGFFVYSPANLDASFIFFFHEKFNKSFSVEGTGLWGNTLVFSQEVIVSAKKVFALKHRTSFL